MDRSEWVLVPRVPTEAMHKAMPEVSMYVAIDRFRRDFGLMLAAAPPPPAEQASGEMLEDARLRIESRIADMKCSGPDYAETTNLLNAEFRALKAALSQRPVVSEDIIASTLSGARGSEVVWDEDRRTARLLVSALAPQQPTGKRDGGEVELLPRFGDWLRGTYASESNPTRDGMYVRTIRRSGLVNPGKFYELTDGNGKFWQYPAQSVERIDRANVDRALAESRAECRKWREKYEDAWAEVGAQSEARAFAEARAERLAEALRDARDYVTSELSREREAFKGHENCSDIPSIEADLAKIDAALNLEPTP